MNRRFLCPTGWLLLVLAPALLAGCVERNYVILVPNAPGAIVVENNRYAFTAPVVRSFRYYGKYKFTVKANGYEDKEVIECIRTPWYEWAPLDFISENIIPWTIRDHRTFTYTLDQIKMVPADIVKARAEEMRIRGQGIGDPLPPPAAIILPQGPVVPQPGLAPPLEVAPLPRVIQPTGQKTQPANVPPAVPTALPPAPPEQPTPTWTPSGR
jgi:hypothetical protein